jgi:hypothetical protein
MEREEEKADKRKGWEREKEREEREREFKVIA